jgi:tRNA U54 and U55 pseudouridine synthase Pus10
MRKSLTWIACCTLVAAFVGGPEAQARPDYMKAFNATYPALKTEAEAAKCGICHPEEKKSVRSDYGKALGTALGEKNVKFATDEKKLTDALKKIESEKSSPEGKTYGEQIKEGKLPK